MEGNFTTAYRQLNPAQRQAVDNTEGPMLVIAGPGTGKTQLLSMRVANILRRADINASNILCLTFTESGQQAIQRRLLELIGETANKVSVHTFHGFGSAIITANPTYFYDAKESRPADDLTIFEILYSIFEKLPHGGPLSSQNNDSYVFLKDAAARISQLKTAGLSPDQLREILKSDAAWCQTATSLIQQTYGQFDRWHKKYLPLIETLAQDLEKVPVVDGKLEWLQPLGQSCVVELRAALSESSGPTISAWKGQWLETADGQLVLKATAQQQRLAILANIYEQYQFALRQRQLFDYDDMILEALQVVSQQPDLLASLQEQFQYLLVDEYQDTNGAQARLVELLVDNPVHEDRPNIMVVGDDDQAIYGFQGADASVMLRFRERWRDVTTIVLTDNYRSTQPILDVSRQLIRQGESRLENYYDDIQKQLTARSGRTGDKPRLLGFDLETSQYVWLIRELQQLLKSGVTASEIAIIAPRHKYLQRLLPYLVEADIGVAYEHRANALTQPDAVTLIQLAKLIDATAHQHDAEADSLLPEVLSQDCWQLSPFSLWQLSRQAREEKQTWLSTMSSSKDKQIKNVLGWLQETVLASKTESLEQQLNRLQTKLAACIDKMNLQRSLDSLQRELQQYQPNKPTYLHDFVRYVSLCQQAGLSIKTTEETVTARQAVQLMTAHKAKGLEFDYVYLIDVTDHIWLTERGVINKISLPANLRSIQPAGETVDDRLRLLYVAATRARQQISFSTYGGSIEQREQQPLRWLETPAVIDSLQREQPQVAPTSAVTTSVIPDWRHKHHQLLISQAEARAWLQPYVKTYRLSPTHLTSFLDVSRGGPRQFLLRHLLQFPEAVSLNMLFGNVLHQTLEQLQLELNKMGQLPTLKIAQQIFETGLSSHHLRPVDRQRLAERGQRSLTHYLAARGNDFTIDNLAELNFKNQDVRLNNARLTGKIDRLQLDKTSAQAVVTDFKTGRAFTKWQASPDYDKHKLHRYEQQLLFYKLLVENSTKYHDYTVNEGRLEFVEPDKWHRIHSLTYHYDATAVVRLTKLIEIVWQKITQLDLPETSHYSSDFSGVRAFEQDLLDGKV